MKYPRKNILIHFWSTTKHKFWVAYYIIDLVLNLLLRALLHDLSKYSRHERVHFYKAIHRIKGLTYGSDEYQECLNIIKPGLDHHYDVNRHHPEHYEQGIEGLSLADLIEMFCDWKASSRRHTNGDVLHSIKINKDRFGMSDQLCQILRNSA